MAKKHKTQRFTRYVERCDNCGAVDSFEQYSRVGNVVYAKCKCGQHAIIQTIVNMRGMRPEA